DERRAENRESRPATELVDGGEEYLGAPLLVEPGRAGDREGPRVRRRDALAGEDAGARAELVRKVDRGHRDEEGGENRQRHAEEQPQLADREARGVDAPGRSRGRHHRERYR